MRLMPLGVLAGCLAAAALPVHARDVLLVYNPSRSTVILSASRIPHSMRIHWLEPHPGHGGSSEVSEKVPGGKDLEFRIAPGRVFTVALRNPVSHLAVLFRLTSTHGLALGQAWFCVDHRKRGERAHPEIPESCYWVLGENGDRGRGKKYLELNGTQILNVETETLLP